MKSYRFMQRKCSDIVLLLVLFLLANTNQVRAEAIVISSNGIFPVEMQIQAPTSAGSPGETVDLTGNVHSLNHLTLDTQGGFHLVVHVNPQGVRGVGLLSGSRYRGTGSSHVIINGQVGVQYHLVNNFLLIGRGQAPDLRIHDNIHLTVLADGTISSFQDGIVIDP